jgi:hypothetical protein
VGVKRCSDGGPPAIQLSIGHVSTFRASADSAHSRRLSPPVVLRGFVRSTPGWQRVTWA